MGATEEQMELLAGSGIDHVAYILILYSLASVLFLLTMALIHVYDRANPIVRKPVADGRGSDEAQLREANEFELDGLVSDDEDEERAARRKLLRDDGLEEDGPATPSTVGRNSDRVA